MKGMKIILLSAATLLLAASPLPAFPFPATDVESIGMGGAYVAAGKGIGSAQFNPAALTQSKTFELVLPEVSLRYDDIIGVQDLMDDIDAILGGRDIATWAAGATGAERQRMVDLLTRIDRNGLDVQGSGTAGVGFSAFGLSLGVGYSDLIPVTMMADTDSAHLGTNPGNPSTFVGGNTTQLVLKGLDAKQIVLTAAKDIGGISLGATLRQIQAKAYMGTVGIFGESDVNPIDAMKKRAKDNTATALDAGVQTGLLVPGLRVGAVMRNLVSPKFEFPDGSSYTMKPQLRAGAEFTLPVVRLAADLDLTTAESFAGGGKYREAGLGAEFDLWLLKLRAGMSKNLALSGSPTMLHAGLGLHLVAFDLDLAGAMDSDQRHYQAGANLAFRF